MSEYAEKVDEFERDGWSITVELEPDFYYEPGRDDDLYVSMGAVQDLSRGYGEPNDARTCERCEGYGQLYDEHDEPTGDCPACHGSGEVPDPDGFTFDTRDGTFYVPGAEVRRLIEAGWGDNLAPAKHAEARESIESTTRAIGHENLSWVGVVVTAELNGVKGSASLWGVDYDNRDNKHQQQSDEYVRGVADDLVGEAIQEAARAVLGGLAPLALSY